MNLRHFSFVFALAIMFSACSRRSDAVFEHFNSLAANFVQSTNQWQLVESGSRSAGGSGVTANSAHTFLVLKQRVDTKHFRQTAAKLIEDFILAQGGSIVESRETAGNTFAPNFRSDGADTAGQLVQYRLGPYRGSISMRVSVFDRSKEAGHVYLEQSSLE